MSNTESGVYKLYEALNKKATEMAERLNSVNLKNISLDDPKDKTFDRVRSMINDCAGLSESLRTLGEASGILVASKSEDTKKPFVNSIADPRN